MNRSRTYGLTTQNRLLAGFLVFALTPSASLAALHDSSIHTEREVGKGTTVVVTLPGNSVAVPKVT